MFSLSLNSWNVQFKRAEGCIPVPLDLSALQAKICRCPYWTTFFYRKVGTDGAPLTHIPINTVFGQLVFRHESNKNVNNYCIVYNHQIYINLQSNQGRHPKLASDDIITL